MNDKQKKWWEIGKHVLGGLAIFYPILQAYLRGRGITLPDLGDFTAKTQIAGAAILAQSSKLVGRHPYNPITLKPKV